MLYFMHFNLEQKNTEKEAFTSKKYTKFCLHDKKILNEVKFLLNLFLLGSFSRSLSICLSQLQLVVAFMQQFLFQKQNKTQKC